MKKVSPLWAVLATGLVVALIAAVKQCDNTPKGRLSPISSSAAAPTFNEVARLNVMWWNGTTELQQLVLSMSDQQRALLGLSVLMTGDDWYAAKVRIGNTGNVPVNVYPENITLQYGGAATGVTTFDNPVFLQPTALQPGYRVEGLVVFKARVDIGAAIRLGGGTLAYTDPTVEVTYSK